MKPKPMKPHMAHGFGRSPFVLLAWVMSGLGPSDLSGPCRGRVLDVLVKTKLALVRAKDETLAALSERLTIAVEAMALDGGAMDLETFGPPVRAVTPEAVRLFLAALAAELVDMGIAEGELITTADEAFCQAVALRVCEL